MSDSTNFETGIGSQKLTWRHVCFAITCGLMEFICVGAWFNTAGIFYSGVAEEFGVGIGAVGLYLSVTFIATMLILGPGGRLLDRANARTIYVVTNALMCAAFAINAAAQNIYMMYFAGVLAGAMGAFDMYLLPVMIARWFKKRTGLVVGLTVGLSGIGPAIWNVVIAGVIASSGWRMGYATLAVIVGVVIIPLSAAFMRSYPNEVGLKAYGAPLAEDIAVSDGKVAQITTSGADYKEVLRSPALYLMIVMSLCGGVCAMMSQYLTSFALSIGYVAMVGASMTSAAMLGNTFSKLLFSWVSDKNITLAILGPIVFPIIGFAGLMIIGGNSLVGIVIMAFLYGTIQPSNTAILPLATRALFGDKDYGRIWGAISTCSSFGCAVGSSIWGFVYDASGTYYVVFSIGIALLLLRCVCWFVAKPVASKIPHTEEVREIGVKNA